MHKRIKRLILEQIRLKLQLVDGEFKILELHILRLINLDYQSSYAKWFCLRSSYFSYAGEMHKGIERLTLEQIRLKL